MAISIRNIRIFWMPCLRQMCWLAHGMDILYNPFIDMNNSISTDHIAAEKFKSVQYVYTV